MFAGKSASNNGDQKTDTQKEIERKLKEMEMKSKLEERRSQEIMERLRLGAGFKPKAVFSFYQVCISLKNDFMFDNM